jgi:hypothetical protein
MGLFELVEDVAERAFRLGRILPFRFASVVLAKRRERVCHGGALTIVAYAFLWI